METPNYCPLSVETIPPAFEYKPEVGDLVKVHSIRTVEIVGGPVLGIVMKRSGAHNWVVAVGGILEHLHQDALERCK